MGFINATGNLNHFHKLNNGIDRGYDRTTVSNWNGHVTINARGGNDQIHVSQRGRWLDVNVNQRDAITLDLWKTRSVTIKGGTGHDSIVVNPNVTAPLRLQGNSGNDYIRPGNNPFTSVNPGSGWNTVDSRHYLGHYLQLTRGAAPTSAFSQSATSPALFRPPAAPWWRHPFHACYCYCVRPVWNFFRHPFQFLS